MENFGKRFEGKVAIITASTQGIGFSIAERLGFEGASVVISSRKQQNVKDAAEKLKSKGIEALGVVCHVSNALQRQHLIDLTVQKYGKIDVIVSNAGVNPSPDLILNTPESALDKLWEVNVKDSVLLVRDAAPYLTKGSSVVFVSTICAFNALPLMTMYGVAKASLLMLTKALAKEMGETTRVNCVAPGYIPTNFSQIVSKNNDTIEKPFLEGTALKRPGTTQEVAAATAFLASNDASYVTGETLVVAGGYPSRL